jgi:hypothetical protein
MDIYGIFQICSIGALASPWTTKLSVKAFKETGMNSIYAWLCILIAGECYFPTTPILRRVIAKACSHGRTLESGCGVLSHRTVKLRSK